MPCSPESNDVFPLPLSLFEHYMFLDDRAGNTMSFPLTAKFKGQFDRQALEDAYKEARQLHPLFCCVIDSKGRVWKSATEMERIIWLDTKPEVFPWTEQYIDITQTPGLRLTVFQDDHSAEFYFLVHHTVSDGMGIFQFMNSLFEHYVRFLGREIVPKSYHPANLRNREQYELLPPPYKISWYSSLYYSGIEIVRWLRTRPLILVSPNPVKTDEKSYTSFSRNIAGKMTVVESKRWNHSGFIFVRLSRETTSSILSKIKNRKQTVAGFFLSRLFLSLANTRSFRYVSQNGQLKSIQPNDVLRIGFVSNLRGSKAPEIPACNIISYTFPTRRFAECLDQQEFYKDVTEEIRFIRDWNVGMVFLSGLAIFRRIPFLLYRLMRSKRCLATAIFSSMNRLDALFSPELPRDTEGRIVIGNVTLLDFQASVPCRSGTNLSITTDSYAGSLGVSIQYNAEKVDANTVVDWITEWFEERNNSEPDIPLEQS